MPSIVKVLNTEITVSTANTVYDSKLVRVYATANAILTVTDSEDNTIGTMTIPGGRVEYVEKSPTDTITANTAVLCVPVSYNT